jgi:hypothetical protein
MRWLAKLLATKVTKSPDFSIIFCSLHCKITEADRAPENDLMVGEVSIKPPIGRIPSGKILGRFLGCQLGPIS